MPAGLLSLCFCYQAGLTPEGATPAAPRKATPGQLQFGKAERPRQRQSTQGTGVAPKGVGCSALRGTDVTVLKKSHL